MTQTTVQPVQPGPKHSAHSASSVQFNMSLASNVEMISPMVDQLMAFISRFRANDGTEVDIELAAHEALANAIVHGNLMDTSRRVFVTCRCESDGEVDLAVQDQGQGFDPDRVANSTAPENRLQVSGRGIYLVKNLMDEVLFENGGSVVLMRKNGRRHRKQRMGIRAAWSLLF